MKEMPGPIPEVPCMCVGSPWVPTPEDCICGEGESALRAWQRGKTKMPPMTDEQRSWALDEIASVEGYSRTDYENGDDAMVARGVLDAWTSYCLDKGLL